MILYWRLKLETELRSRKYSRQTRNIYIYFIRTLCRALQKTPEEIGPSDVKQFLEIMEKAGYPQRVRLDKTSLHFVLVMNYFALGRVNFYSSTLLRSAGQRGGRLKEGAYRPFPQSGIYQTREGPPCLSVNTMLPMA
jgi:hypothetical protein